MFAELWDYLQTKEVKPKVSEEKIAMTFELPEAQFGEQLPPAEEGEDVELPQADPVIVEVLVKPFVTDENGEESDKSFVQVSCIAGSRFTFAKFVK